MAYQTISQDSFVAGELGDYLINRISLDLYKRGAARIENWVVLPHGGVQMRRGFRFVYELPSNITADAVRLAMFDFNKQQQYLLIFTPLELRILRNYELVATITTPYGASDLANLRFSQSGDTFIITQANYQVRQLVRSGSDTNWTLSVIDFKSLPFHRYNITSKVTPSATTGNITLTLNTVPAWRAGHADNVAVQINSGVANILNFPDLTPAAGGEAVSNTGTAANVFDNNTGTTLNTGANGWVGYGWTTNSTVRLFSLQANATSVLSNLICEVSNSNSFATTTNCGVLGPVTVVGGVKSWFDVPVPQQGLFFRVRGQAGTSLDMQEVEFASGLVANATVTTTLTSSTISSTWQESGWSAARGYPRTGQFYENRLVLGGTRDAPATVFGSTTGDFFDFLNTGTNASASFGYTLSTDQVHIIRDLRSKRNLNIFTTDGEFELSGGDGPLTSTSVQVKQQSSYGISDIPVLDVEDELIFNTSNFKEIRSFVYNLATDKYQADNKTVLGHHLFVDGKEPYSMAYLRGYRDTQANFLFASREDGQMAVLTVDTVRQVLAWSRWNTQGFFRDLQTVNVQENNRNRDTLFAVVQRRVNGVDKAFVEALTENDVYLDHFYLGSNTNVQTNWNGLTTLPNTVVTVLADNLVSGSYLVNNTGTFSLPEPANAVAAGLPYTANLQTLDFTVAGPEGVRTGRPIRKYRAVVAVHETRQLSVDNNQVSFRQLGTQLLDQPIQAYTGLKDVRLRGINKDCNVVIQTTDPLGATVLAVTTYVKSGPR